MDITRVVIKNFQSHQETDIALKDGINVFVGTSDSGKSAILRALKWNLINSPSGGEFIKEGTNEATVTVYFKDGHSVERSRNKTGSKNTYTLLKDGVVIEEYTGFGSKVPPAILEVTRINPDFSFNFANQLEAPFLLSDTPKVRAETIGNLEELGQIDSALTKLNEDVRDKKREQKSTQSKMKELEKERNALITELNVSRVKAETIQELKEAIIEKSRILDVISKSANRIQRLEEDVRSVQAALERANRVLDKWDDKLPEEINEAARLMAFVTRLLQMENEAKSITYMNAEKLEQLIHLTTYAAEVVESYRRLSQLKNDLERNAGEQKRLQGSFSKRAAAIQIEPVDLEVARFSEILKRSKRLKEAETMKKELERRVDSSRKEIESLLTQFVEALQEVKTCPTCMQQTTNITEHQLQHSI